MLRLNSVNILYFCWYYILFILFISCVNTEDLAVFNFFKNNQNILMCLVYNTIQLFCFHMILLLDVRERERELDICLSFQDERIILIRFLQIMYYFSLKYDSILFIIISFLSTQFFFHIYFFLSTSLFLHKGTGAVQFYKVMNAQR